ncbi:MAG: response regulator [Geminicoccaceae bacterium]|jgi:CheY-like chemotaxis protein|nr:response regulator [Geminicoccaceae bacterium]
MTKILYVEDNEDNIYMLRRRLERQGIEVIVAGDGAEGIASARREHPDLILMDLSLPVIDGWEAARRLKGSPDTQAIPIIALSAHAMTGDRERALAAGCDDYDTKPVDFRALLAKIQALLPQDPQP